MKFKKVNFDTLSNFKFDVSNQTIVCRRRCSRSRREANRTTKPGSKTLRGDKLVFQGRAHRNDCVRLIKG